MRLYGISVEEVEAAIAGPAVREVDERGKARLLAEVGAGRHRLVVIERTPFVGPPRVRGW